MMCGWVGVSGDVHGGYWVMCGCVGVWEGGVLGGVGVLGGGWVWVGG